MKLYLFIAAGRDTDFNETFPTYEKSRKATGIPDARITTGFSVLAVSGMIHAIKRSGLGVSRSYRIVGLDTRRHSGTTGRNGMMLAEETFGRRLDHHRTAQSVKRVVVRF